MTPIQYKRPFHQIVESKRKIDSSAWIKSNQIFLPRIGML